MGQRIPVTWYIEFFGMVCIISYCRNTFGCVLSASVAPVINYMFVMPFLTGPLGFTNRIKKTFNNRHPNVYCRSATKEGVTLSANAPSCCSHSIFLFTAKSLWYKMELSVFYLLMHIVKTQNTPLSNLHDLLLLNY